MRSPGGTASSCPATDDALWWDGFALPILNGEIKAATVDGGDLIVGGDFTEAALTQAVRVARWNGTSWSAVGDDLPGRCRALAWWNGHLVAGCDFAPSGSLVYELHGTSWTPLGIMSTSSDGYTSVAALTVHNGDLIAGGYFDHADGDSVGCVVRWDGTRWQPIGGNFPAGEATAVAVYGTKLVAAGNLSNFDGIAQWNGATWSGLGAGLQQDTIFALPAGVASLLVSGTKLYVSGSVGSSGGVTFTGLPQWDGSSWSSLGSIPSVAQSRSLALYNGELVASRGGSTNARWNGSSWVSLGDGLTNEPTVLVQWGPRLVCAGFFGNLPGAPLTNGILQYDGSTWSAIVQAWSPGIMAGWASDASAAVNWRGQLVVGGGTAVGAQDHMMPTSSVASWDGVGWTSVGAAVYGPRVLAMTVWNDSLVVGFGGNSIGGVSARHIARWDGASWNPIGQGFSGLFVNALAVYNGSLCAFGPFHYSGTTTVNGAARWDGGAWQPMGGGFDTGSYEIPYAALQWGADLYAAGDFPQAGGVPVNNVARWDGTSWSALGAGVDDDVLALVIFDDNLIVGGAFKHAGGIDAQGVARWDGFAWSAVGDNALAVGALRVLDGRLFAAGEFRCPDGSEVYGLAIWNGERWVLTGSGFGPAYFSFIEPYGGDLYVGGRFGWANGHPSSNIARWTGYSLLSAPVASAPARLELQTPRPNPSGREAELDYMLPSSMEARFAIYDVSGRRVATLAQGRIAAGPHHARWSGRDQRGLVCAAGLYFARLETELGNRSVRLVRSQ